MKFAVVLLLAIVAFISSSFALKDDICALEHSKNGDGVVSCNAYFPSWSYVAEANECRNFVYGGCGGNENRFDSLEECEQKCKE
ncbi:male accessory gland serine protease inhibitor-like [Musca vetustissima]|uniref:male accessory gland serine protease inhibitor-like n=1 Tax=Musca vetustissima TaxID=27455 RepID=UPI002AB5EC8B|nr:male accessory gland serine protease inhibitor-like [Musca vetustissima]